MIVSVVIPCYNGAGDLRDAVRSLLTQRVAELEIILVDDKSTDGSLALMHALAAENPQVKVLALPRNRGPGVARNKGLAIARGRYVGFLDIDDRYSENVLAHTTQFMDEYPWVSGVTFAVRLDNLHRDDVTAAHIESIENSIPSNIIVRTAAARAIGGFPEDEGFRTNAAGEDVVFRHMLRYYFVIFRSEELFLSYKVRSGSHFDKFIECSTIDGEGRVIAEHPEDAALQPYIDRYYRNTLERIAPLNGERMREIKIVTEGKSFVLYVFDNDGSERYARDLMSGSVYPPPPIDLGQVRTIADIGAHVGAATVMLKHHMPRAVICAIEPDPRAYALLVRNTSQHRDIHAYRIGLAHETGSARLFQGSADARGSSMYPNALTGPGYWEVEMVKASDFFHISDFDVIKIDAAGNEVPIITSALASFVRAKVVYVRFHSDGDRREIDTLLSPTHIVAGGKVETAHHGDFMYVRRDAFLSPQHRDQFAILRSSVVPQVASRL